MEAARCISLAVDWQLCLSGRRLICTWPESRPANYFFLRMQENRGRNQKSRETNKQRHKGVAFNSAARTEEPWRAEEQSDHLDASTPTRQRCPPTRTDTQQRE